MNGNKNIRTTLGKLVSSENEENWWRTELFEKNTRTQIPSELEIIAPPPAEEANYNCFVYALGFQNDQRLLGNAGWEFTKNLGLIFDEMIDKNILKHNDTSEKGFMILYCAEDELSVKSLSIEMKTPLSQNGHNSLSNTQCLMYLLWGQG